MSSEIIIKAVAAELPGFMGARSANGANRNPVTHAVLVETRLGHGSLRAAACNKEPGRRSYGWYPTPGKPVTCKRCLKKIKGMSDPVKMLTIEEIPGY